MTPIEIAEVFEAAADDTFKYGIDKGDYGTKGGARCATGHLQSHTIDLTETRGRYQGWGPCYAEFGRFLLDTGRTIARPCGTTGCTCHEVFDEDGYFSVVVNWNDAYERTAEDVREAFLLAAKDLRNDA